MERLKSVFKRLIFIPGWLMIILGVFSAAALVAVFVKGWEHAPASYAVYTVSAYALVVITVFFAKVVPEWFRNTKKRVMDNPLGNRFMTDRTFKTVVSLYSSLTVNLLYSAFKLVSGIYYSSLHWISVAGCYITLSVIRFHILRYMRSTDSGRDMISEYKKCRLCGVLMLVLNFALSVVVLYMTIGDDVEVYPQVLAIASAAYTFYRVTVSVIDIAKYRRRERPVIMTSRAIRLAAALISMLSLEATMLATFGNSESFRRLMTAIAGAGVCLIITVMSVYIIVTSDKAVRKLRADDN